MGIPENKLNPEVPAVRVPPDADPKGSKDPKDFGDNGNPAQSAVRPSAQEADASPAPLNEDSKVTREA